MSMMAILSCSYYSARKRPRKSQTPRRGLQPHGSTDNTSSEGEGSDQGYSPSSSTIASAVAGSLGSSLGNDDFPQEDDHYNLKKPKLAHHHQQHESDDNGINESAGGAGIPEPPVQTPLSGRAFKKESGQVQTPHAEVRSVETIVFKGDRFHFTHRFWRGKLLRRRFDFYGSYSIVPTSSPSASPSSSPLPDTTETTSSAAIAAAAGLMSFTAMPGEKDVAAEESRLRELTEGKVILHWPSQLDAPELRDWQFDKSYSHVFLAVTPSSLLGSELSEPGSTLSPLLEHQRAIASSGANDTRKRPHFLYTKHGALFIEDAC